MKTWIAGLALITTFATGSSALAEVTPARWLASASKTQAAPTKRDLIERLKKLQSTQASELATIETAIHKQLQETMKLNVAKEDVRFASAKASVLATKVDELNKRRSELNARREMVDRLIFAIDTKYSNQPLQQFLEQQFLEMASTDLADGRDSRMWKAFTYMSIAIREVPEPREDMFDVIEGYMNYTNILDPKTPAEFLASRNYTNGNQSVAASPVSRDEIGDDVEVNAEESATRAINAPRTLELRMTMPKPNQKVSAQNGTVSATTQSASESVSGSIKTVSSPN